MHPATRLSRSAARFFQADQRQHSMQPIRAFNFSRGTNARTGHDLISFLIVRKASTARDQRLLRGANVRTIFTCRNSPSATAVARDQYRRPHPQGSSTLLKPSTFSSCRPTSSSSVSTRAGTNNDNAWLFVKPEPRHERPPARPQNSLGAFDSHSTRCASLRRQSSVAALRGNHLDEYRMHTYADVTPHTAFVPPPDAPSSSPTRRAWGQHVLAGVGARRTQHKRAVVASLFVSIPTGLSRQTRLTQRNFTCHQSVCERARWNLLSPVRPDQTPPRLRPDHHATDKSYRPRRQRPVQRDCSGTAPLTYQWLFNTNTPLPARRVPSQRRQRAITNAGLFIRVSNAGGVVTSTVACSPFLRPGDFKSAAKPDDPPQQLGLIQRHRHGTAPLRYQCISTRTRCCQRDERELFHPDVLSTTRGLLCHLTNNYGYATSVTAALTVAALSPV